jgi:exopolyphosphatase / guanosine-5'-triphosphate,3'-diphosphate pyrophosphatase
LKVSVIDLGFNSLKLISYDVREHDSTFVAYDQESVPARLGEGLSQTGFLGTEPVRRAIDGLKFFKEVSEIYGVRHSLPVATSAVREAANRDQFLKEVFEETGFKFRVLSGREEALFSYSGAVRALGISNVLFFDIGGGSVEFVYGDGSKIRSILSLPLGGLRLTQLYADKDGSFREKARSRMEKRIFDLLPSREELGLKDDTLLAGVGGSVRALTRWDQNLRDYPFNKIHNYSLKRESVDTMSKELSALTPKEIAQIDVIGKDRAETLSAGSLVIDSIMKKLGFRRLLVSTHGLRDGVLAAFLEDPLGYHKGKTGKMPPRITKSQLERDYELVVGKFLERLGEVDLIELGEDDIIRFAVKWLMGEASALRPESVFSLMMDEDSPLPHRDQLLGSLAVVELHKARSANWFYSRYRSMLRQGSDALIEKYAAISHFLEILIRTDSKIAVSFPDEGSKISLKITTHITPERFPQKILEDAVNKLGDELDRFIEYKVKNIPKSALDDTQTEVEEEKSEDDKFESEKQPFDS